MSITFRSSFKSDEEIKKRLEAAKAALEKATQFEVTEIKRNMNAGKGFDGSSFAPYSDGYAKYRQSVGRSTEVNLTLTGELRSSIQSKAAIATKTEVEGGIFILDVPGTAAPKRPSKRKRRAGASQRPASTVEKAHFVQEGRKPRKFFGLSNQAIARIVKRVQEAIKGK